MLRLIIKIAFIAALVMAVSFFVSYRDIEHAEHVVFRAWSDLHGELQNLSNLIHRTIGQLESSTQIQQSVQEVNEARIRANAVYLDLSQLENRDQVHKFAQAQKELRAALNRLLVLTADDPAWQSNQEFQSLRAQLEQTESRILAGEQNVNTFTESFNREINTYPGMIVNNLVLHKDQKVNY